MAFLNDPSFVLPGMPLEDVTRLVDDTVPTGGGGYSYDPVTHTIVTPMGPMPAAGLDPDQAQLAVQRANEATSATSAEPAPPPRTVAVPDYFKKGSVAEAQARSAAEVANKKLATQEQQTQAAVDAAMVEAQAARNEATVLKGQLDRKVAQDEANEQELLRQQEALKQKEQVAADFRVDPDRYRRNAGTGRNIGWAILAGLQGYNDVMLDRQGPNSVMQMIDVAIARDIDAQEKELSSLRWDAEKAESAYSRFFRLVGSPAEARELTRQMELKLAATNARATAAVAKSKKERLNGQALADDLEAKANEGFAGIQKEAADQANKATERRLEAGRLAEEVRSHKAREGLEQQRIDATAAKASGEVKTMATPEQGEKLVRELNGTRDAVALADMVAKNPQAHRVLVEMAGEQAQADRLKQIEIKPPAFLAATPQVAAVWAGIDPAIKAAVAIAQDQDLPQRIRKNVQDPKLREAALRELTYYQKHVNKVIKDTSGASVTDQEFIRNLAPYGLYGKTPRQFSSYIYDVADDSAQVAEVRLGTRRYGDVDDKIREEVTGIRSRLDKRADRESPPDPEGLDKEPPIPNWFRRGEGQPREGTAAGAALRKLFRID